MTTTVAPILAIDLGKYKSVACWYTGSDAQALFETFPTHPDTLRLLLQRQAVRAVVVEACVHAGWVHDLCAELKVPCHVAVTSGEAWKWKNVKRKTDRDDALKLAHLFAVGQLHTVCVPAPDVRQWKALIGHRRALVHRRVSVQNRIRALIAGQGQSMPRGAAAWAAAGLHLLDEWARPLAECGDSELWRGQLHLLLLELRQLLELVDVVEKRLDRRAKQSEEVQLLDSIPGVGIRTAEEIVTHLGDAKRFTKAAEVSAFAGLVPRQYQSGESDRRGRVTKRGPKRLRTALVECAWAALRYNAWARAVYLRISRGSKSRKKQAVVALARKLLVRCWAMLRDKQKWRDPPTATAAEGTAT